MAVVDVRRRSGRGRMRGVRWSRPAPRCPRAARAAHRDAPPATHPPRPASPSSLARPSRRDADRQAAQAVREVRAHAHGPARELDPLDPRQELLRSAPAARARARCAPRQKCGPPRPNAACIVAARVRGRGGPGRGRPSGSRLADANQTTTLSPARIACPASSVSQVAVRRKCQTGEAKRSISSTASGISSGSARRRASCVRVLDQREHAERDRLRGSSRCRRRPDREGVVELALRRAGSRRCARSRSATSRRPAGGRAAPSSSGARGRRAPRRRGCRTARGGSASLGAASRPYADEASGSCRRACGRRARRAGRGARLGHAHDVAEHADRDRAGDRLDPVELAPRQHVVEQVPHEFPQPVLPASHGAGGEVRGEEPALAVCRGGSSSMKLRRASSSSGAMSAIWPTPPSSDENRLTSFSTVTTSR